MIPQKDLEKIIKLLNLSTSDNNHEALLAIRSANKILKQYKLLWDRVVNITHQPAAWSEVSRRTQEPKKWSWKDYEPPKSSVDIDDEIEEMLEVVLDNVQGGAREFVESLAEQFESKGFLTEKQMDALRKFYDRCN